MDDYNNYNQQNVQKVVVTDELSASEKKTGSESKLSVASLAIGVVSLVFFWACGVSLVTSLVGLIIGIVSLAKSQNKRGIAIGGIVTSVLAFFLSVAMIVIAILVAPYWQ